jgi:ATP-binding cassette subfamily B protein
MMKVLFKVYRQAGKRINFLCFAFFQYSLALLAAWPLMMWLLERQAPMLLISLGFAAYLFLPRLKESFELYIKALGNENRMQMIKLSFAKCLNIDYEFFESEKGQRLFSNAVLATNSSSAPYSLVFLQSAKVLSSSAFIIGSVITALTALSLTETAVLLCITAFSLLISLISQKKGLDDDLSMQGKEADINRNIRYLNKASRQPVLSQSIDYYSGSEMIDDKFMDEGKSQKKLNARSMRKRLLWGIAETAGIILASFLLLSRNTDQSLSVVIYPLAWQCVKASIALSSALFDLKRSARKIQDFQAFLDHNDEMLAKTCQLSALEEIELQNVSFAYPSKPDHLVLKSVSLRIAKGEKIGIVGLNGSGKSTLIKLIMGFYAPTSGRILINGVDLQSLSNPLDLFGCIFQDDTVIPSTIRDNVLMGRELDSEKYNNVLVSSGLKQVLDWKGVNDLAEIPSYYCQEGTDLSGGEMQSLFMARCLYKDASFYVFDEPTAMLDPIKELEVFASFRDLIGKSGGIFISHRASSVKSFDRIVFIENGSIVEDGDFDSLMKKEGRYEKLFQEQAQYYR